MSRPTNEPVTIKRLCEADADVLDAMLEARARGAETGPMPAGSGERAERLRRVLSLLEQLPVQEPAEDLPARTMERIRQYEQRQRFNQQVAMLGEERRGFGLNWRSVATGAAVFLIGLSLLFPTIERGRQDAARIACQSHLKASGQAINAYAIDHENMLPRDNTLTNETWWQIEEIGPHRPATVQPNFPHLRTIVELGYIDTRDEHVLICPTLQRRAEMRLADGRPLPADLKANAYDYQNQYHTPPVVVDADNRLVVLADKSPLFVVTKVSVDGRRTVVLVDLNRQASPTDNSTVHPGGGQNVLRADGSASWEIRPVVDRFGDSDNIWIHDLKPGRRNAAPSEVDSFLVP